MAQRDAQKSPFNNNKKKNKIAENMYTVLLERKRGVVIYQREELSKGRVERRK